MFDLLQIVVENTACNKAEQTKQDGPKDTACRLIGQAITPLHLIDASQNCRQCPQSRYKATEEDRFIPMPSEKFFCPFNMFGLDEQITAIAFDDGFASCAPDIKANIVAHNGPYSCTEDDQGD